MNNLVTVSAVPEIKDDTTLRAMSTKDLLERLASFARMTAENLVEMSRIVRVLEERGEDLSRLRLGWLNTIRKIAYGQLIPEAAAQFIGFPTLMQRIAALPIPDQKRLASGEPVPLVVSTPSGKLDHRLADPIKMGRDQITQVFAADHLRDEQERILYLQSRQNTVRPSKPKRAGSILVDRERGLLTCRNATQGEVLEALAELRGATSEGPGEKSIASKLNDDEYKQVKTKAIQFKCSVSDLVRRALYVAGLIGN